MLLPRHSCRPLVTFEFFIRMQGVCRDFSDSRKG
jgi:hypothetical protein